MNRKAFTLVELFTVSPSTTLRTSKRAFTLVELLVVVTIIVVLVSLLLPAMGRAMYQAQLASCGATLRASAGGAITYTFDQKRFYPPHLVDKYGRQQDISPSAPLVYIDPMTLADTTDAGAAYDIRPPLAGYVQVNKMLQDPMLEPAELEHSPPDAVMEASYVIFWGWKYNQGAGVETQGMFKTGDVFTFVFSPGLPDQRVGTYNILIGDMDIQYPGAGTLSAQASHPDITKGVLAPTKATGQNAFGVNWWFSRFMAPTHERGELDDNFAYDDNSVGRIDDVPNSNKYDERVDKVALQYDARRYRPWADWANVPRSR